MRLSSGVSGVVVGLCMFAPAANADIAFLTQDRSISAMTSADANAQSIPATDFGPFVANLDLAASFTVPGGGTALNTAGVGIDCQLDPNGIKVKGRIKVAGGLALVGTGTELETGEANAVVNTTFHVDTAMSYMLLASERPSTRHGDKFKIKIKDLNTHTVLFLLDETSPPEALDLTGVFGPGDYSVEYEVEMSMEGDEVQRDFTFSLLVPAPGCGGLLLIGGVIGLRRRR